MKDEALKLALEVLEQYTNVVTSVNDPNSWETVGDGGKPARDAITAIKQALAAPVKDNSNYRLDPPGLDPAGGTQVSKVWWDGEKLMAKPIPFVEFYKPVQEPVAVVDANDEGYWADILPDRAVKVGQLLYAVAQAAPSQYGSPELQEMIVARALEKDCAAQPAPVQVSPLEFVTMVMEKEHLVGKPLFWAEWPNKENT
jgi:hypothetical protein